MFAVRKFFVSAAVLLAALLTLGLVQGTAHAAPHEGPIGPGFPACKTHSGRTQKVCLWDAHRHHDFHPGHSFVSLYWGKTHIKLKSIHGSPR